MQKHIHFWLSIYIELHLYMYVICKIVRDSYSLQQGRVRSGELEVTGSIPGRDIPKS